MVPGSERKEKNGFSSMSSGVKVCCPVVRPRCIIRALLSPGQNNQITTLFNHLESLNYR
uniref:Uncharacterized protein n=1 Tax=Anguilla anguilla TaxID=7936 RepID=A0A0E9WR31_ANGAN